MRIFETERLIVNSLEIKDQDYFVELISDSKITELIPQPRFTESEISQKFSDNLNLNLSILEKEKCVCGIFEKGNPDLIGLCLFLTNDENEKELGYRFRVDYWGKGYGTEITRGMLNFYFNNLNIYKVTADVNTENLASIKILNKFMKPVKEFINKRDKCTDLRYEIEKNDWQQKFI